MSTSTLRPGLTAATTTARQLLAAGWQYDSTTPMATSSTSRLLLHPSGREIEATTSKDGDSTTLTLSDLSLEQVAGAITGAGLTAPVEHYHVGGVIGGLGENEVECACGLIFGGFDSQAAALAFLDRHIADPRGEAVTEPAETPEQPADTDPRRTAYNLVAAGVAAGLPIPDSTSIPSHYSIFEVNVAVGDQAAADAWAAHLNLPAPVLSEVMRVGRRGFRNYGSEASRHPAMPGWKVQVSCHVDEPKPEEVEEAAIADPVNLGRILGGVAGPAADQAVAR